MDNPSNNLLVGLRCLFPLEQFPWDGYAAEMADADVQLGRATVLAAKSFYVRNPPFRGAITYLFGVTQFLRSVSEISFDTEDFIHQMQRQHRSNAFIAFMRKHKRLKVRVYAAREGTIFGPNEPIISVVGYLPHVRLVEGMMNIVNPASLLLTKWRRCVLSAHPQTLSAFDRRRAQNAPLSTLAALAAGVYGSSNEEMERYFGFPLVATMGHEWPMAFDTIEESFDAWLAAKPHKAIGLIDTHSVLDHDFPAWLDAVWNHRDEIKRADPGVWGWRNDSGDLAYLSLREWQMFLDHPLAQDQWFVKRAHIFETNDLDEYLMDNIRREIAERADEFGLNADDVVNRLAWACGTKPGTASEQPSLGGVAKLMQVEDIAKIKLAFNAQGEPGIKTSIPGFNLSAKIVNGNGKLVCILIFPAGRYEILENGLLYDALLDFPVYTLIARHPTNPGASMEITDYHAIPQQTLTYDTLNGDGFVESWPLEISLNDVPAIALAEEALLDRSILRLKNAHLLKISVTRELFDLRMAMITDGLLSADALGPLLF